MTTHEGIPLPPPVKRWSVLRVAAFCGMAALLLLTAAVALMAYRRATASFDSDDLQNEIKTSLVRVSRSRVQEAKSELSALHRHLRSRHADLDRHFRTHQSRSHSSEEQSRLRQVFEELGLLQKRVDGWRRKLEEAPLSEKKTVWVGIVVDIVRERKRWPLVGAIHVPRMFGATRHWWAFRHGFSLGALWPLHSVRGARQPHPAGYGIVRRTLFPYGRNAGFRTAHIAGMALSAGLLGYCLVWLGAHRNSAWASYSGLLYFAYMIVFGACLLCLHLGLLT